MAIIVEISEYLRAKMVSMAVMRESLTHPDVVSLSQRLDRYIVQAQRVLAAPTDAIDSRFAAGDGRERYFSSSLKTRTFASNRAFRSEFGAKHYPHLHH